MAPTLYQKIVREDKNYQRNFRLFLAATARETSPVSAMRGHTVVLTQIRTYLKPDESHVNYKVLLGLCVGGEHCHVEALLGCGGWIDPYNKPPHLIDDEVEDGLSREWSGSLSNLTMFSGISAGGMMEALDIHQNADGSYFSEMQLRDLYHDYCLESCDSRACSGACGALPGDTVFWRFGDVYRDLTRFESATEEELQERGWLSPDGSGLLSQLALDYRQSSNDQDA
jgi:hypothetical protein